MNELFNSIEEFVLELGLVKIKIGRVADIAGNSDF